MKPAPTRPTAEDLFAQMSPAQARAIEAAFKVHSREVVRGTMDSRERVRLRNALDSDTECHAFRAIARIARMDEEVAVDPLQIVEQIVAEDGPEFVNETNRGLHNVCSLRSTIQQALDMQQQYYLPSAVPESRLFIVS